MGDEIMPNGDKVKAATKHGPSVGEKRAAIVAAKKKVFDANRKLDRARHEARTFEDSTRLTEHEENMHEQKLKREAKAAKAAQFRALAESAAEEEEWPGDADAGAEKGDTCGAASKASAAQAIPVAKNVVLVRQAPQSSDAQVRAQVDALVIGRRKALESARQEDTHPGLNAVQSEEEMLDGMLDGLVERGVLSEAQQDRITDSLASGELTVPRCLELCFEWAEGNVPVQQLPGGAGR